MILIVSSDQDAHALVVANELRRRGESVVIGDVTEFSAGAILNASSSTAERSQWIRADGTAIDFRDVTCVWCRRYFPANFDPALRDAADRMFVQKQWLEALWGVVTSLDATLISDPFRQKAATKPLQLSLARRIGLRVPETLISNDRETVIQFVERHKGSVIHKTLAVSDEQFLYTKRWDDKDATHLNELELAPMIFQSMVTGAREVRITIVGEQFFTAEFKPQGHVDGRLDNNARYVPHELPEDVKSLLRTMMCELGLSYSTVDMRIDDQGNYVFLDLNPQGQYLFVEIRTGQPITAAMADLLQASQFDRPFHGWESTNDQFDRPVTTNTAGE
ncbi:MAG: hypothetical protein HKN47_16065 [Pirellulaceae bacterium]|nr:hypothetical protein [Pirellulaceae bacterium]